MPKFIGLELQAQEDGNYALIDSDFGWAIAYGSLKQMVYLARKIA